MKIAYVITRSDEVGGAHIHVRDLSVWLRQRGHEVKVFVGGDKGAFIDILEIAAVDYRTLRHMKRPISPIDDVLAVRELAEALESFEPDVVSAHSAKAGVIARLACRRADLPCIFTAHGWSFTSGVKWPASFIYRSLEKLLAPLSRHIVTVCENDRQLALDKKVADPDKLVTIHNGMPQLPVGQGFNPGAGKSNDVPVLIMVARFEDQKDHGTLIEALATLTDLPWELQLVGDGPLVNDIRDLAQELGIAERIDFLGRRLDVPELLRRADIFVLSTNWEGFPRSILEAMRAGLPVVATEVAGVPEAVEDGVTGYLVPARDVTVLAERIRRLIDSQSLRRDFGERAHACFVDKFTFTRMAEATLELYEMTAAKTVAPERASGQCP
ncbi:glycosyltransferase family 4 protein [Proteobacteria bacterium 005FR1]|nr:glycosyltransferase family 4 protein [Proteobacteria bacterium 005FR1]